MQPGPMALFLVAAVLVGVAIGYSVAPGPEVAPPPPPPAECPKPSDAELDTLCAGRAPSDREALVFAQTQVDTLSAQLSAKESELKAALAEADRAGDQKDALVAKARKLEGEISTIRAQLTKATTERDQLATELKEALAKLDDATLATDAARTEARTWQGRSAEAHWSRFVAEAKVEICDRGTAKKHESCHSAVDTALGRPIKEGFQRCVGTGQAVPTLGQLEKNQKLPAHAVALQEDKAFPDKGWFVQLCDPTLPEAGEPARPAEPAPAKPAPEKKP
jgi:hypothetical protein